MDSRQDIVLTAGEALFFEGRAELLPLYARFKSEILRRYPEAAFRVQKTQITFYQRRVFACVSLLRVGKKRDLPGPYLTVTLGLPAPLQSPRAAVQTQPYPGRWTAHIPLTCAEEIDGELMGWVQAAYDFTQAR